MSREKEITNVLLYLKSIYESNPSENITMDTIYHLFATYGISREELNENQREDMGLQPRYANELFSRWTNDYSKNIFLNVYHDAQAQPRFLQFNSGPGTTSPNHYKLYLTCPKEKMYSVVRTVFDFIAENKMRNHSKVADCVRADSIVLRMDDENDVIKVINYINANEEIYKYCRATNPFLGRWGVVGYAFDRNLSYNQWTSFFLHSYFQEKVKNNQLGNVSLQDFRNYLDIMYNRLLNDKNYLNEFMKSNLFKKEEKRLEHLTVETILTNIIDVLNILRINMNMENNITNYLSEMKNVRNNESVNKMKEHFASLLKYNNYLDEETLDNDYEKVLKVCEETTDKYGIMQTINALRIAISTNNYQRFTNSDNRKFLASMSNAKFKNYAQRILKIYENEYNSFMNICLETAKKYNLEQLRVALISCVNEQNYRYFTGQNNRIFLERMNQKVLAFYATNLLNKNLSDIHAFIGEIKAK